MIVIQHVAVAMDSPKNISHYKETFLVELLQTLQLLYSNTSIEFHKTNRNFYKLRRWVTIEGLNLVDGYHLFCEI